MCAMWSQLKKFQVASVSVVCERCSLASFKKRDAQNARKPLVVVICSGLGGLAAALSTPFMLAPQQCKSIRNKG